MGIHLAVLRRTDAEHLAAVLAEFQISRAGEDASACAKRGAVVPFLVRAPYPP